MADVWQLHRFASADALCASAAERLIEEWRRGPAVGNTYCMALSGGRVARTLFTEVSRRAAGGAPDFVNFFWADERCLPPADPETNYAAARECLFNPLGIPPEQIHRIMGEKPAAAAAAQAEAEICRVAPLTAEGQPILDLVLLGMGEDGHVASLFPGEAADSAAMSAAVYRPVMNSPKPPPQRVTMGYAAIAAAKKVWVIITGEGKKEALQRALELSSAVPLGRVLKQRNFTEIYTDR